MRFGLRRKLARCGAWPAIGATPDRADADAGATATTSDLPGDFLRVVVERHGSALLVRAGGSVDASNIVVWGRLVGEAAGVTAAPGPLIIDTNGLEFMGVCAFEVLVEESARCRGRGIELCLVSAQPVVARVVAAAGLDRQLSFSANIDGALGCTPREGLGPAPGG